MGCGTSKATVEPVTVAKGQDERPTPHSEPTPTPAALKPAEQKAEAPTPVKPAPQPAAQPVAEVTPPKPQVAEPAPVAAPQVQEPPPVVVPTKPPAPKRLILVLGGPGSGVSEQCAKLHEVFGCHHLLVGKLMRAEVMSESDQGKSIAQMMNDGKIIPSSMYTSLYKKAIDEAARETGLDESQAAHPSATFLIDGFPRSVDSAKLFEEQVGSPKLAILISAPEAIARERARTQDGTFDEESFGKRLASYAKRTLPMLEQLEASGLAVSRVDASGTDESVFVALCAQLGWAVPEGVSELFDVAAAAEEAEGAEEGAAAPSAVPSLTDARTSTPPVPVFSVEPAEDTPLKSITGAVRAHKPVPDARKAVVFFGVKGELMEQAKAAMISAHGFSPIELKAAMVHALQAGTAEAAELKAELDAGKILPSSKVAQLLDSAMSGPGPYVIVSAGSGAAVLALLSSTVELAPVAVSFGQPAEGEALLAAAYRVTGRSLVAVEGEEDLGHATATVLAALGLAAPASAPASAVSAKEVHFVLGGPGSGKGTQCELLTRHFGYAHFSAGDLLRDEVSSGSELGVSVGEMIKEGKIVPAQVTIDLLQKAMRSRPGPYLIDGFPRSMDNAKSFEEQVGVAKGVLFFDVSEATLEARLLERGKTSGRSDDNKETILKRFKTFQLQSLPVVEYLATITTVHKISGEQPKDLVFAAVCKALGHAVPDAAAESPATGQ